MSLRSAVVSVFCAVGLLGAAMVATSVHTPATSAIYHYPEMTALGRVPVQRL